MTLFNISISNISIYNKEDAAREINNIWKSMSAVKVGLEQLRYHIETKHNPFICCARKSEWKNQRLFCIDIDNFDKDFNTLICNLDELELYPCFGYTTFNNADNKINRFRLLFQLSENVTDIEYAKKVTVSLFNAIEYLYPGAPDRRCTQPYHLFYPGKEVILFRPDKIIDKKRIDNYFEIKDNPHIIVNLRSIFDEIKKDINNGLYVPSLNIIKKPSSDIFIIIDVNKLLSINISKDINISMNNISYYYFPKLLLFIVSTTIIIAKYNKTVMRTFSTQEEKETQYLSIFEHYQKLALQYLCGITIKNNNSEYFKKEELLSVFNLNLPYIYKSFGIKFQKNNIMTLPINYAKYAKAVLNFKSYENLDNLFKNDKKNKLLSSIILSIRDEHIKYKLNIPAKFVPQYVITYDMIINKLKTKFNITISKNTIRKWIKEFNELKLIHLCSQDEKSANNKKLNNKVMVMTIPYFTSSRLKYVDSLAKNYKAITTGNLSNSKILKRRYD